GLRAHPTSAVCRTGSDRARNPVDLATLPGTCHLRHDALPVRRSGPLGGRAVSDPIRRSLPCLSSPDRDVSAAKPVQAAPPDPAGIDEQEGSRSPWALSGATPGGDHARLRPARLLSLQDLSF